MADIPADIDETVRRLMCVTVERTPYVELEAHLPATTKTSVALHLTGRCMLEWAPGGRPLAANPTRGDVTLVPAGRSGLLRVRGGPCEVLKLGIDDSMLAAWAEREERAWPGNPLVDAFSRRDPLIQQIGLALLGETERSETVDTLYRDALTNALLAHLLRHYVESEAGHAARRVHPLSARRAQRAIDLMACNLTRAIGLADIAGELGLSPSHFAAQFKARLGRTPGRYLTGLRLERARALLEQGRLNVSEVAEQVGYSSVSHFTQAFRAEFGETPSAWRERRS